MENRLLRYFIAIANEENISHAAKILHVTQPTLSRQMLEFEENLGVKLFDRGNRKITLTDKGILLYERAKEIIELTDKAEREMKESNETINGNLILGCAVTSSARILSNLVKKFRDKYPFVQFELVTGTMTQIKEKMDKGLVDIGLFVKPITWNDYETVTLNNEERFGVLMLKNSKWADKEYITTKDLKEMTLSIPKTTDNKSYVDLYGKTFEQLNVIATHDLINNAAVFVEAGIYNAITLVSAIDSYTGENLCCIPIFPEVKTTPSLAWKKHYSYSPTVVRFIELIKEELKEELEG